MPSHTPGPWQIRHDDGVSRVFRRTKIADVYSEAFRDSDTQKANASLIAAAPDLLEACRFAHSLIDSKSRDADRIEEKLRKAIEKAVNA